MNDLNLYETIPKDQFPIRLHDYSYGAYSYPCHWHEHLELHFIFSGCARLHCGDQIIDASKGDCVIINGNELHESVSGQCSYGCMILPPSFLEDHRVVFRSIARDSLISEWFIKIYTCLREKPPYYEMKIKGFTYLLLSHLLQNYVQETLTETEYAARFKKLDTINAAIRYIDQHFAEKITIETLAAQAHLSKGYFCHLFKAIMGTSAQKYLTHLRMEKAVDLLKNTDMKITEVALCSGFSDSNYFARMFRQLYHQTPHAFRKNRLTLE